MVHSLPPTNLKTEHFPQNLPVCTSEYTFGSNTYLLAFKLSPWFILVVFFLLGDYPAVNAVPKPVKIKDKPTAVALIPYLETTFNQLSRLLGRHNIKCIAMPPTKISNFLPKIKDDLGLRTPGIYSIPCECGKVYIGQTGRTIENRIKEHQRNTRLLQTEKSALAEHSLEHIIESGFRTQKFYQRHQDIWSVSLWRPSRWKFILTT
jgi:hypothetical protein